VGFQADGPPGAAPERRRSVRSATLPAAGPRASSSKGLISPERGTVAEKDGFRALPGNTRRVYDLLAGVYPLSSRLFHEKAHKTAAALAGIEDGMNVLEVATGSGEMFRRLVSLNSRGVTCGIDLSPRMAARTQRIARLRLPHALAHCHAVDARSMPFRDGSFDAVVCCYLFELLSAEDIAVTLGEIRRVLRRSGRLAVVMIGQDAPAFNVLYRIAGRVAPAFWGRQAESVVAEAMNRVDFSIEHDRRVRQGIYPSRIVVARR
jgi:ubiquinone/menaquinone biosynthesis C-methylase UbiE